MERVAVEGTIKIKLPSKSVTVAFVVPFWITVAPIIGSPLSSFMTPWTLMFCAKRLNDSRTPTLQNTILFVNCLKMFIIKISLHFV